MDSNMRDFFKNKKIVITGGTGLIGRSVVKKLCDYQAIVKIISLDKLKVDDRADHVFGDLTDFNFCKDICKDQDYAFHMSGIKGSVKVTIEKPASFFVPLIMMNTNFLEACRLQNIKRLVYTSSIGAYSSREIFKEEEANVSEPPMDMYPGWAKRMAELQIQSYKKQYNLNNFFTVRPCNVYGPGDNFDPNNAMVIPTLMNRIYNKGCNEDPLFVKIVEKKNKLSPNAETSFYLAILKEKSGLTSEALSYYNQAVDLESDDFSKAKILYKIATNFKNKGSYGKARSYYKKALKLNPSLGKAYLAIANMYSKSANNCGDDNFSKRAVYWLAAKEASKASRVSPNLSKKVSEYIANYSAKAPQKSEIFSSGREGQIISIGCCIQRKVTVPNIQ